MKTFVTLAFSIAIVASALPARAESHGSHQGHDATTHDCMAMQKMDKTKMNTSDPAMKAMHDKCMKQMHGKGHDADASEHDHSLRQPGADGAQPEHQHDKSGN